MVYYNTYVVKNFDEFQKAVWQYYVTHGRPSLPWRLPEPDGSFDPYKILVSELMLQQTQVNRVIPKYHEFLAKFPDVRTLAKASLGDVLIVWSGLGYNRRAKFLWQAAQKIQQDFAGEFPRTPETLTQLPGVGKNTAGAVLAYAFNRPSVFIETNIRTVYIHHFFHDQTAVADAAIQELVARTLPKDNFREWYWALMDYGSHLKQAVGNVARASKTYTKQSKFEGSKRQVRGQVLRVLHDGPRSRAYLTMTIMDDRLGEVLNELAAEGFIIRNADEYLLA